MTDVPELNKVLVIKWSARRCSATAKDAQGSAFSKRKFGAIKLLHNLKNIFYGWVAEEDVGSDQSFVVFARSRGRSVHGRQTAVKGSRNMRGAAITCIFPFLSTHLRASACFATFFSVVTCASPAAPNGFASSRRKLPCRRSERIDSRRKCSAERGLWRFSPLSGL